MENLELLEAKHLRMRDLGSCLGLPVPQLFLDVQTINPDGSFGDRCRQRSHTFVRNFWDYIFVQMCQTTVPAATFGAGLLGTKDIAGTIRGIDNTFVTPYNGHSQFSWSSTWSFGGIEGIYVGVGTSAESLESFDLASRCTEGTGTNQFNYAAESTSTPSYDSGTKVWTSSKVRVANNNSSATIVVTETGIIAGNMDQAVGSTPVKYLMCRDLLGSSVSVLAGGQLTVTYTFSLTFPA